MHLCNFSGLILFEDAFVYGMSIIQIGKHIDRYARDAHSFALTKSTPSLSVAPPSKQPANPTRQPSQSEWTWAHFEYITNCIHIPRCFFIMLIYKIAFMCIANAIFTYERIHKRLNVKRFSIDAAMLIRSAKWTHTHKKNIFG